MLNDAQLKGHLLHAGLPDIPLTIPSPTRTCDFFFPHGKGKASGDKKIERQSDPGSQTPKCLISHLSSSPRGHVLRNVPENVASFVGKASAQAQRDLPGSWASRTSVHSGKESG